MNKITLTTLNKLLAYLEHKLHQGVDSWSELEFTVGLRNRTRKKIDDIINSQKTPMATKKKVTKKKVVAKKAKVAKKKK